MCTKQLDDFSGSKISRESFRNLLSGADRFQSPLFLFVKLFRTSYANRKNIGFTSFSQTVTHRHTHTHTHTNRLTERHTHRTKQQHRIPAAVGYLQIETKKEFATKVHEVFKRPVIDPICSKVVIATFKAVHLVSSSKGKCILYSCLTSIFIEQSIAVSSHRGKTCLGSLAFDVTYNKQKQ